MRKREKTETLEGLAHSLWVQRGKPIGSPEVDWSRAEQLLAEISESIQLVNTALEKVQHGQNGHQNSHESSGDSATRSASGNTAADADAETKPKPRKRNRVTSKTPKKQSSVRKSVAVRAKARK